MDELTFTILFILFFVLFALITLPAYHQAEKKKRKIRNEARNADTYMQHFCYYVPHSREEIWLLLEKHTITDELEYTVEQDIYTITFREMNGTRVSYWMIFKDAEDGSFLKIELKSASGRYSDIPLQMNDFWAKKLEAKPVAYYR